MSLRNGYILAFLGIISFFSCEKDDICDGQVATPKFRIEFYDRNNSENLKPFYMLRCYVLPETGNETTFLVFNSQTEIQLPLNINSNQTIWNLEITQIINNDTLVETDQLIFNYTPKAEYVSKACGYKTIFTNLSTSLNQNGTGDWITNFSPLTNNIINEENPHAKIYY